MQRLHRTSSIVLSDVRQHRSGQLAGPKRFRESTVIQPVAPVHDGHHLSRWHTEVSSNVTVKIVARLLPECSPGSSSRASAGHRSPHLQTITCEFIHIFLSSARPKPCKCTQSPGNHPSSACSFMLLSFPILFFCHSRIAPSQTSYLPSAGSLQINFLGLFFLFSRVDYSTFLLRQQLASSCSVPVIAAMQQRTVIASAPVICHPHCLEIEQYLQQLPRLKLLNAVLSPVNIRHFTVTARGSANQLKARCTIRSEMSAASSMWLFAYVVQGFFSSCRSPHWQRAVGGCSVKFMIRFAKYSAASIHT